MGNFVAGDIVEINCSHEDLGDFRFSPKANESFTLDTGGLRTADDSAMVTGDGQMIQQINRVLWSVEGAIAIDLTSKNEMEGLPKMAASPKLGVWTFTHISGAIYKGKGKPVGDLQADSNAANQTLKVAGGGVLEKIS